MTDPLELFRSVEAIWLIWLASIALFCWMTGLALNRFRWGSLRRLFKREDGAAYTLSVVMVLPIYMYLMCLIIETTLVLTAKVGTVYASYSGARSAIVWSSAARWPQAEDKIRRAAVEAMVPFASGTAAKNTQSSESVGMRKYLDAYEQYVDDPAARQYLAAKYRYAEKALDVKAEGPPAKWHSDITVSVEYEFPFNIPGIGIIMGTQGSNGKYVYRISSQATLQNEGPKNETQTLGISYASPR